MLHLALLFENLTFENFPDYGNSLKWGPSFIDPKLFNSDGTPDSSPAFKAILLNFSFSKNFNTFTPPLKDLPVPPLSCPENILLSEEKTWSLICSLDASEAMGPGKYSARMLKETASSIAPMITAIFNMSLSTGVFPDSWKSSLIVFLPKSGDLSNPSNYGPVSLLTIVSKLLEMHVCDLLYDYFNIPEQQWGFHVGESTTNHILSATIE